MSKPTLILVILVTTLQLANHVSSQPTVPTFRLAFCRNTLFGNYTTNSTYEDNLRTVLSDLEEHTSTQVFYNSSSGTGASTVHGQYFCREDVSSEFCTRCIQEASQKALNCSNAKAAVIWYNECTLRYMNESMYGLTENHPVLQTYGLNNLTTPGEFSGVLNDTVTGLIQEAAQGNGFAAAQKTVSVSTTAYFLVQCSLDLTRRQCESCLTIAFNETRTCCGEWPVLLYSFFPSCQVMYNTVRLFYFTPNALSPAPSSSAKPPSPRSSEPSSAPGQVTVLGPPPSSTVTTKSTPITGGSAAIRSIERMKLTIITIALVVLMLVLHK